MRREIINCRRGLGLDRLGELERLQLLRDSGTLTDEEFQIEKTRILGPAKQLNNRVLIFSAIALALAVLVVGVVGFHPYLGQTRPAPATAPPQAQAQAQALKPAPTTPVSEALPATSKLQQLFRRDILGAQLPYLEASTGPARNVVGSDRTYLVEGCEINVHADGKTISSIGLARISPKCNVSLKDFGFDGPMTDHITFGMLERIGFATQYSADCLDSCGNAFDPFAYALVQTPHVNGFVEFRAGANTEIEPMLTATMKWADLMRGAKGEDYVTQTRFNCDQAFNPAASRLFANMKINSIEVGNFPAAKCQ